MVSVIDPTANRHENNVIGPGIGPTAIPPPLATLPPAPASLPALPQSVNPGMYSMATVSSGLQPASMYNTQLPVMLLPLHHHCSTLWLSACIQWYCATHNAPNSGRPNPHPSILPPSTLNPIPSTADQDRKYLASDGMMLVANLWGSSTAEDSSEGFTLLWSEGQQAWLAIYCMSITVCVSLFHLIFLPIFNQSIVLQHI